MDAMQVEAYNNNIEVELNILKLTQRILKLQFQLLKNPGDAEVQHKLYESKQSRNALCQQNTPQVPDNYLLHPQVLAVVKTYLRHNTAKKANLGADYRIALNEMLKVCSEPLYIQDELWYTSQIKCLNSKSHNMRICKICLHGGSTRHFLHPKECPVSAKDRFNTYHDTCMRSLKYCSGHLISVEQWNSYIDQFNNSLKSFVPSAQLRRHLEEIFASCLAMYLNGNALDDSIEFDQLIYNVFTYSTKNNDFSSSFAYFALGYIYGLDSGVLLQKAINLNPTYSYALSTMAFHCPPAEQQKYLKEAIRLDCTNADAYFHLGLFLREETVEVLFDGELRAKTKKQLYIKAIQLDPKNSKYFQTLGSCYQNADDIIDELPESPTCFQVYCRAIELDPSNAQAYHNLGTIINRPITIFDQQFTKRDLYLKAIELDPNYSMAFASLSDTLAYNEKIILNEEKTALDLLLDAIALDPNNRYAYFRLAQRLAESNPPRHFIEMRDGTIKTLEELRDTGREWYTFFSWPLV